MILSIFWGTAALILKQVSKPSICKHCLERAMYSWTAHLSNIDGVSKVSLPSKICNYKGIIWLEIYVFIFTVLHFTLRNWTPLHADKQTYLVCFYSVQWQLHKSHLFQTNL